jgi:hypothetical protein
MQRETAAPVAARASLAQIVQVASVVCFVAAALSMLVAGALHASGRTTGAAMSATLGYAVGVAGIATGVLALILDPQQENS